MAATKTSKTVKAPAKKAAPVKKTVTKKAAPAKAKAVVKPAAKPAAKKAAPAKAAAKKTVAAKKPVVAAKAPAKKTPVKKAAAPKKAAAAKMAAKPKITDPIRLLALALEKTLDTNKAEEIVTIDLKGRSALADWMIVASGKSGRQVSALANYVQQEFAKNGYKHLRVEGLPQGDWVIVDSGDVVVHLFRPEVREFYQLEKLWETDEQEPTKRISLR